MKWFVTTGGRFGGALNVPTTLPGSLRSCLLIDGGNCAAHLAENEGFAIVRDVGAEEADLYRRIQLHAATHVAADGGAIIVSPLARAKEAYVGFVGRCEICPNAQLISFRQLQKAVPEYNLRLFFEWENWRV